MNPSRASETKEGLHKAIDRAHGEGEPRYDRRDVGVKYVNNFLSKIENHAAMFLFFQDY